MEAAPARAAVVLAEALDERDVRDGRERVDELEEEELADERVRVLHVRAPVLVQREGPRDVGEDGVEDLDLRDVQQQRDVRRRVRAGELEALVALGRVAEDVDGDDDDDDEAQQRADDDPGHELAPPPLRGPEVEGHVAEDGVRHRRAPERRPRPRLRARPGEAAPLLGAARLLPPEVRCEGGAGVARAVRAVSDAGLRPRKAPMARTTQGAKTTVGIWRPDASESGAAYVAAKTATPHKPKGRQCVASVDTYHMRR